MISKLLSNFLRLDSSVKVSVISAIISATSCVLSISANVGISVSSRYYEERSKSVDNFVSVSKNFENIAFRFVAPVVEEGKYTKEQGKFALLENLIDQSHALDQIEKYIPDQQSNLLKDYESDLDSVKDSVVNEENGKLDPFFAQAKILFFQREKIIKALQGPAAS